MFFKPSEKLSVGISYRSKIDAQVKDGDVTFRNLSATVAPRFQATKFAATLPLPPVDQRPDRRGRDDGAPLRVVQFQAIGSRAKAAQGH